MKRGSGSPNCVPNEDNYLLFHEFNINRPRTYITVVLKWCRNWKGNMQKGMTISRNLVTVYIWGPFSKDTWYPLGINLLVLDSNRNNVINYRSWNLKESIMQFINRSVLVSTNMFIGFICQVLSNDSGRLDNDSLWLIEQHLFRN